MTSHGMTDLEMAGWNESRFDQQTGPATIHLARARKGQGRFHHLCDPPVLAAVRLEERDNVTRECRRLFHRSEVAARR